MTLPALRSQGVSVLGVVEDLRVVRAGMLGVAEGHGVSSAASMTRMDFHLPERNRSEKQAAMARI